MVLVGCHGLVASDRSYLILFSKKFTFRSIRKWKTKYFDEVTKAKDLQIVVVDFMQTKPNVTFYVQAWCPSCKKVNTYKNIKFSVIKFNKSLYSTSTQPKSY